MAETLTDPARVLRDAAALAAAAADAFVEEARSALDARGVFFVALAGGTTFLQAYRLLAGPARRDMVDWARTIVFFGDERCVPADAPERNDRAAREALLDHVPIPGANVHTVDAAARDAAPRYEAELLRAFSAGAGEIPRFDLVLLGLGPDGHVASLFPGHDALREAERLVVRIAGSPKPPPERVTFTLPLLNAAAAVLFVASGASKREAARRARAGDTGVPAALVAPSNGRTSWLLDAEAAGESALGRHL